MHSNTIASITICITFGFVLLLMYQQSYPHRFLNTEIPRAFSRQKNLTPDHDKVVYTLSNTKFPQHRQINLSYLPNFSHQHFTLEMAVQYVQTECTQFFIDFDEVAIKNALPQAFIFCSLYSTGGIFLHNNIQLLGPLEMKYYGDVSLIAGPNNKIYYEIAIAKRKHVAFFACMMQQITTAFHRQNPNDFFLKGKSVCLQNHFETVFLSFYFGDLWNANNIREQRSAKLIAVSTGQKKYGDYGLNFEV